MALSNTEKMRKAQVLARAIWTLRKRMKVSQEGLAEAMGGGTDVGSISRWERGEFSPGPSKRRRLAAMARKRGWGDLIPAFDQPLYEWKAALLPERDRHLLALFELLLLNKPEPGERLDLLVRRQDYAALIKSARKAVRGMRKAAAMAGRPFGLKTQDGREVLRRGIAMVTDEQVAAWQREMNPRSQKRVDDESEPADRPGLVIRYMDGHIEMYRDTNEYEKVKRQRAREAK